MREFQLHKPQTGIANGTNTESSWRKSGSNANSVLPLFVHFRLMSMWITMAFSADVFPSHWWSCSLPGETHLPHPNLLQNPDLDIRAALNTTPFQLLPIYRNSTATKCRYWGTFVSILLFLCNHLLQMHKDHHLGHAPTRRVKYYFRLIWTLRKCRRNGEVGVVKGKWQWQYERIK